MHPDPQPDEEFEADLVLAFGRAADDVGVTSDPLVTGGLARGRTRRRRRRIAAVGGGCLALAVLAGGALAANSLSTPLPVATTHALADADAASPPPPHLDKGVNILLIGLDGVRAPDGSALPAPFIRDQLHAAPAADPNAQVSDTLVMLHLPAGDGPVTGMSLPRDAMVPTQGLDGGEHKLGTVYSLAQQAAVEQGMKAGRTPAQLRAKGQEAGRAAVITTVQHLLGVPVDHLVEIDMAAFYDIAQAVGPIDVCLNQATQDRYSGADFHAGRNTLDAAQALAFVRQRHGVGDGSDLSRLRRQQAFLSAVLHTLKQQGVLTQLDKADHLFAAVGGLITVDAGWNPLDLARQVPALLDARTVFTTMPVGGEVMAQDGGATVDGLRVDPAAVQQAAKGALSDPAPAAPAPRSADGVPCVD
ncbi:LCP family protein [Kitasatospora sp. NPDC006697]|uniref:LCP family protein n=1 Tax=Kitasatospora sp. NPDC006697 TaxID=3364020 RepID=UPI003685CCCC